MAEENAAHRAPYLLVFIALCVFTALSVISDLVNIPNQLLLIVIVLAIATAKALCVMAFFMHLRWEGNWKYLLLAPTIILATGIPLALLPDIGVHYYRVDVPQVRYAAESPESPPSEEPPAGHDH